eukprot:m.1211734 g.1211734  ORF g.1211734 m.1211734 type:complete len:372 (-) comp24594_c0_seq4:59-1174(-)
MAEEIQARDVLEMMNAVPDSNSSTMRSNASEGRREFKHVRSVKRELTRLHRQLIDEEDEEQLLFLFRETKRLKEVMEKMMNEPQNASVKTIREKTSEKSIKVPPPVKVRKSAQGMLIRSMYLPNNQANLSAPPAPTIMETEGGNDQSDVPLPPPPAEFMDPSLLPPPVVEDDVLAGLDNSTFQGGAEEVDGTAMELPPPPPDETEDGDYFVCWMCHTEGYGEIDERDGNFYCFPCWEEYSKVGCQDDALSTKEPRSSLTDPSHPDYWKNLKASMHNSSTDNSNVDGADGSTGAAPTGGGDDAFARFSLAVVKEAVDGPREESTTPDAPEQVAEMDNLVDVMLLRIQDKRKSMRFIASDNGEKGAVERACAT